MPIIQTGGVAVWSVCETSNGVPGNRFVTNAADVDIGLMCQIHEVVDDQPVVASEFVERAAFADPVGAIVPVKIRHLGGIGQRRIAGPDPHQLMALNRLDTHARRRPTV